MSDTRDAVDSVLSREEQDGILAIAALNRLSPRREIRREWRVGRFNIVYHWRHPASLWGRFGGGWQWEIGVQAGGSTLIVSLLVASVTFTLKTTEPRR
jgi:hypothetical protein